MASWQRAFSHCRFVYFIFSLVSPSVNSFNEHVLFAYSAAGSGQNASVEMKKEPRGAHGLKSQCPL